MPDPITLVPSDLHAEIDDIYVTFDYMRVGANEDNAYVQFPRYLCVIEDKHGLQGSGFGTINDKTTPEEAYALAIERAVENLLMWRDFMKHGGRD